MFLYVVDFIRMGVLFSCCYKCLEQVGIGGGSKSNRRQNLQTLLSNRDNPNVDGRKAAVRQHQAVEEPRPVTPVDRRQPAAQPMRSPATPDSPNTYSPLNNSRDKLTDSQPKRPNFGSFQQRSANP